MSDPIDPYADLRCPIPGCDGTLMLESAEAEFLTYGMLTGDAKLHPDRPFSRTWEVRCLDGHVLLMPEDQNDHETFGDTDWGRLRALTELRGGVVASLPRQGGRELLCDGDNPSWRAGRSRVTVADMQEPCRHDLSSNNWRCDECGEITG